MVFEAIATAGDGDGLGVMEKAIQNGAGGGHIAQELSPVLNGTVAGHDGRTVFIAAHDHFQEIFAGVFGQGFEAHIVNDEQIRLQVFAQYAVLLVKGFIFKEVPDQVENGAVEYLEVELDGFVPEA